MYLYLCVCGCVCISLFTIQCLEIVLVWISSQNPLKTWWHSFDAMWDPLFDFLNSFAFSESGLPLVCLEDYMKNKSIRKTDPDPTTRALSKDIQFPPCNIPHWMDAKLGLGRTWVSSNPYYFYLSCPTPLKSL